MPRTRPSAPHPSLSRSTPATPTPPVQLLHRALNVPCRQAVSKKRWITWASKSGRRRQYRSTNCGSKVPCRSRGTRQRHRSIVRQHCLAGYARCRCCHAHSPLSDLGASPYLRIQYPLCQPLPQFQEQLAAAEHHRRHIRARKHCVQHRTADPMRTTHF